VTVDGAGDVFISDSDQQRVRRVSPHGIITTVAGNGLLGFSGDGGQAVGAELACPFGIAVDGAGSLFIADEANIRVRKVAADGTISTLGSGPWQPAYPVSVAADSSGNAFVADVSSHVTRASPDGVITAVAMGYAPAVDSAGNLYFALNGSRVFKLTPDGATTVVAGNGSWGFSGDGGPATAAQILANAVAVDPSGNIFIADASYRIRKVSPDGIITTIAGNGTPGYSGDRGSATSASISVPAGLAVDSAGNVYFCDRDNNAVRVLRPVIRRPLPGRAQ
jgi:sugar lactone lactonase YvrE